METSSDDAFIGAFGEFPGPRRHRSVWPASKLSISGKMKQGASFHLSPNTPAGGAPDVIRQNVGFGEPAEESRLGNLKRSLGGNARRPLGDALENRLP